MEKRAISKPTSPDPLSACVPLCTEEYAFSPWSTPNPSLPRWVFSCFICTLPYQTHMEMEFWGSWSHILSSNVTQNYLGKCLLNLADTCLVRKTVHCHLVKSQLRFTYSCLRIWRRMWTWSSFSVESLHLPPSYLKICPYSHCLLSPRNQPHVPCVLDPLHPISEVGSLSSLSTSLSWLPLTLIWSTKQLSSWTSLRPSCS